MCGQGSLSSQPVRLALASYAVFHARFDDFDEYFGFSKCHSKQKILKFMVGLTPALLQRDYLVDPSRQILQ